MDLLVSFVYTYLHKLFVWISKAVMRRNMKQLYSIGIFLPSIFSTHFLLETEAFHMPIHSLPARFLQERNTWRVPSGADTHATWPSACQLLYRSSSVEKNNLFWWKYWVYLCCLKGRFCTLPCCLNPGDRGRKICEIDFLHSRNSTVKLFLFAFVSLYSFQTLNCSPLNAISHCFIVWFCFARKPP